MSISDKVKAKIRDVKDFPKEGIVFKDITPVLSDPRLCKEVAEAIADHFQPNGVDVIAAIESRGFIFGMLLSQVLHVPFVPIRKLGKLPAQTVSCEYELEYGKATIEMHIDAIREKQNVLIHDDLLATGGTATAAAQLVHKVGAEVTGFSFLVDLTFLGGKEKLISYSENIHTLADY